ncbi:unnamed protein product [Rotaria sordida]|uniref:Integrase catalytic domain-containing protein n=1 Tax=Rotaria sordida TaxID=392033 RepID=A0A814VGZ4_9BILA|nr:unnamed protein product [Rotaria sordida]CAF1452555.1 unnamed protein product [Rotaria sordida]
MTNTLQSCRQFCLVYLDDIIVFSKSYEEHINHLEQVFSALQTKYFVLNPPKCETMVPTINYLAHTISEKIITPMNEKIQAILDIKEPHTLARANKFIDTLSWYRKFLPNFATIAAPIHSVTNLNKRDRRKFKWTSEQSTAFHQLKQMLITEPLFLHFPVDNIPLILTTDASNIGIGGVLQQEVNGQLRNLYYHPQLMTPCERKSYLLGRRIIIQTDHCPLCNITKKTVGNARVDRIAQLIQEYNIEQDRDPDIQNIIRRLHDKSTTLPFILKDNLLRRLITHSSHSKTKFDVIYLPASMVKPLFYACHDGPMTGEHFSIDRTYNKIKNLYRWLRMKLSILQHIKSCLSCQQYNISRQKRHGQLHPIPPPDDSFLLIGIDFCGPLKRTPRENQYVLVITDNFTRYITAIALPNCTAETTAQALFNEYFCKYSIPSTIISDQGAHFQNHLMQNIQKLIGYNHIYSTPYHPQTNGIVERFNSTFIPQISKLQDTADNNWDEYLQAVVFAYNSGIHKTTKYSPYELLYGRQPRLPIHPRPSHFSFSKPSDYFNQLQKTLRIYHQATKSNIIHQQEMNKNRYDQNRLDPHYNIGDKVLTRIYGTHSKLDLKFSPIPKKLSSFQQFALFNLSQIRHPLNLQQYFTNEWNRNHPHLSPRNTQQRHIYLDPDPNLELIVNIDTNDLDDNLFPDNVRQINIRCTCPDTIRPYKNDNEQWSLQKALQYTFNEALDKALTFNAWSCGLDPLLHSGHTTEEINTRAALTTYAINDVLAPTKLLFHLHHDIILRYQSPTTVTSTSTIQNAQTQLPSYFVLSDSHVKHIDSPIDTEFGTITIITIPDLKWCDTDNPHLCAYSLLQSTSMSLHLSTASAIILLIGTNSLCRFDASQVVQQAAHTINYLHQPYPNLHHKEAISIVAIFPCFKFFPNFPSPSSLSSNIDLYNEQLNILSTNIHYTVIDFQVTASHLASDHMHLHSNHQDIIYNCIVRHFQELSQQPPST